MPWQATPEDVALINAAVARYLSGTYETTGEQSWLRVLASAMRRVGVSIPRLPGGRPRVTRPKVVVASWMKESNPPPEFTILPPGEYAPPPPRRKPLFDFGAMEVGQVARTDSYTITARASMFGRKHGRRFKTWQAGDGVYYVKRVS